jgi:hypothetical protein
MIIYYIDGEKYIAKKYENIPIYKISSPNENTPAYENLESGYKFWCKKGDINHRLTGPSSIWPDGYLEYWLNGKKYENVNDWLKHHPNKDNAFQVEMLLKYT